jgi:hypothetical protein
LSGPIQIEPGGFICGVSITLTCKDQGWGNRKGRIKLQTKTPGDETKNAQIWMLPQEAEHAWATTSHFIKADNKEIIDLNADITSMRVLQLKR